MVKLLAGTIALVLGLAAAPAWAQVGSTAAQPLPGTEKNDSARMSNNDREAAVASERVVRESRERAIPARAGDLVIGAEVRDAKGVLIGTIELVDAGGVQILSGAGRARISADAFGKNSAGLMLAMTKEEFDKAVAASLAG